LTALLMAGEHASAKGKIYASWHCDDIIAKTGKFPPMRGVEIYSTPYDSFPQLRGASYAAGEKQRHGLPFIALGVGWHLTYGFRNKDRPSHHIVSEAIRNVARANPVTTVIGGIASGVIHLTGRRDVYMAGPGLLTGVPLEPSAQVPK
jgi:hypothetical protein